MLVNLKRKREGREYRSLIICMIVYSLLTLPFLQGGASSSLEAKPDGVEVSDRGALVIEWKTEPGAQSYIVEIKDHTGKIILNQPVETNKIRFNLPIGKYSKRVASVNKFDKISSWSDWQPLNVVAKKGRDFSRLIPGPAQLTRGETLTGSAWIALFTGLIAYNYSSFSTANQKAVSIADDPIYPFFTDPFRNYIFPNIVSDPAERELLQYTTYIKYRAAKKDYLVAKNNQRESYKAIAFAYIGYLLYEFQGSYNMETLIPGQPQRARGDRILGDFWSFSIGTALTYGLYSEYRADAAQIELQKDITYRKVANPFFVTGLTLGTSGMFVAHSIDRITKLKSEYTNHKNNRDVFYTAATILYIGHLIDAFTYYDQPHLSAIGGAVDSDSAQNKMFEEPNMTWSVVPLPQNYLFQINYRF